MKKKKIDFSERQAVQMAHFISALERDGTDYTVISLRGGWTITIVADKTDIINGSTSLRRGVWGFV